MATKRQKAQKPGQSPRLPVAVLPQDVAKWRRLVRERNTIIAIWLGGLTLNLPVPFALLAIFPSMKDLALGLMVAFFVCWISACLAGLVLQSSLDDHFRQTIARNDISSLGCWIDTLFSPVAKGAYPQSAGKHYQAARAGLLEHLPLLTEETAYLLRADERHALYKSLYGKDEELIHVVLEVVPNLGDARALSGVRHLAAGKGLAAANTELQVEAQSSLHRLQSNLDLSSGAQGLLRASQHPQTADDELLIPAHANSATEASELMRANIEP